MSSTPTSRKPHMWPLVLIFLVHGTLLGTWASRLPTIKDDLMLSNGDLGLVLLVGSVGAVGSLPMAAWLMRRTTPRQLLRALIVPACALTLLIGFATNAATLALALAVSGISMGLLDVAMNASGLGAEQASGRHIMSRLHAGWSAGNLIGAFGALAAIRLDVALSTHFIIGTGACAIVGIIAVRSVSAVTAAKGPARPTGQAVRVLLPLAAVVFCAQLGEAAAYDWVAVFVATELGHGASGGAAGFAAIAIAMTLTRLSGDWLSAHIPGRQLLQAGGGVAALGTGVAILAPSLAVTLIGLAVLGAGVALAVPIGFRTAGAVTGIPPATGIAVMASIGYGAFVLGPPVIGGIAEQTSLTVAMWCVAGVLALVPVLAPAAFNAVDDRAGTRS